MHACLESIRFQDLSSHSSHPIPYGTYIAIKQRRNQERWTNKKLNEMKLSYEVVKIRDVEFGNVTCIQNGVLIINKAQMLEFLKNPKLKNMNIEIAKPGESVRIVPVKDVLEPRIKITDNGGSFPGYFGKTENVGSGTTRALEGCVVTTVGRIVAFQEGIIDMRGPGADYCYHSEKINVVCLADPVDGVTGVEHETQMRVLGIKASYYLAQAAKEASVDEIREYELKPVDNSLPKVAYIYCVMAQGLLHDSSLYGMDCKKIHPTVLHPNEILDSVLVSGSCVTAGDKCTTYDHQTNPVIDELYKHHGKDLNFVGVIISPICAGLADKVRCSNLSVRMAKLLGAEAVIISEEGGGNPEADVMMLARNSEKSGLKSVVILKENAGWDGTSEPITDSTPEADAAISVGNMNMKITLPKMERTIGYPEAIEQLSGSCNPCENKDGSINVTLAVLVSSISDIGKTKFTSIVY
jgi:sarcosine reductase